MPPLAALWRISILAMALVGACPAHAVDAVALSRDVDAIELTPVIERHRTEGDRIEVSMAPGRNGIVHRMEVRARQGGTHWAVFALANTSDFRTERLIVVPRFRLIGSGLLWPDLDFSRVANITPSAGSVEHIRHPRADVFRIAIGSGEVVTYVAEMRSDDPTQFRLWNQRAFSERVSMTSDMPALSLFIIVTIVYLTILACVGLRAAMAIAGLSALGVAAFVLAYQPNAQVGRAFVLFAAAWLLSQAFVLGWLNERGWIRSYPRALVAMLLANAAFLAYGTLAALVARII
jgi:hypothetical protein